MRTTKEQNNFVARKMIGGILKGLKAGHLDEKERTAVIVQVLLELSKVLAGLTREQDIIDFYNSNNN